MPSLQVASPAFAAVVQAVVDVLPLAREVLSDIAYGVVVLSFLSVVGIRAYCGRFVDPMDDRAWVTKIVVEAGNVQRGLVVAVAYLYAVLAFDALFGTLASGVATSVVLTAAVLVVAFAGLLPVAELDLFERTPYGTFRRAALDATVDLAVLCGGVTLGVAFALHLSYWAVPLGVLATVGFHALQPWFVAATNDVEQLPDDVLGSLDPDLVADLGPDRLWLLDDDVAQMLVMGVVPGRERIYLTRTLLDRHPPAELEALLAYVGGISENRHNQEEAVWWSLFVALFLLAWVVSLWLLVALLPVLYLTARRGRQHVYAADAVAAERTSTAAMTDALERFAEGAFQSASATGTLVFFEAFPSIADRVYRLGGDRSDLAELTGDDDDDRPGVGSEAHRTGDDGAAADGPDDDWERLRA